MKRKQRKFLEGEGALDSTVDKTKLIPRSKL